MSFLNFFVNIFLLTIGVITSKRYNKFKWILISGLIMFDVSLVLGLFVAFLSAEEYVYKIRAICSFTFTISVCFLRIFSFLKRKHLLYLTEQLAQMDKYFGKTYQVEAKKGMREILILIIKVLSPIYLAALIIPYIHLMIAREINYNDPGIYLMPYLFKYKDIESLHEYLGITVLQSSVSLPCVLSFITFTIVTLFILFSVKLHCKNIARRIQNVVAEDIKIHETNRKDLRFQHEQVFREFKELMHYQQYVHIYLEKLMLFVNWTYCASLLNCLLISVFLFFELTQVPIMSMNTAYCSVGVSVVGVSFFVCCHVGESITDVNYWLLSTYYETLWYESCIEIRKNLLLNMALFQRTLSIRAFNMYIINFKFYAQVLKTIYSWTNILRLMNNSA